MIGKYEFNVLTNYIKCSAFSSASKYEEAKLQEIFFIPKLRSRIIVNLESGKRSNEPSSITILSDGSLIMSVTRYYEKDERIEEVEFYWNGDVLYWEDLIDNLAEYTALITNV